MTSRCLKRQGRDPIEFEAHCLENGWIYRLGYNETPVGNCT